MSNDSVFSENTESASQLAMASEDVTFWRGVITAPRGEHPVVRFLNELGLPGAGLNKLRQEGEIGPEYWPCLFLDSHQLPSRRPPLYRGANKAGDTAAAFALATMHGGAGLFRFYVHLLVTDSGRSFAHKYLALDYHESFADSSDEMRLRFYPEGQLPWQAMLDLMARAAAYPGEYKPAVVEEFSRLLTRIRQSV